MVIHDDTKFCAQCRGDSWEVHPALLCQQHQLEYEAWLAANHKPEGSITATQRLYEAFEDYRRNGGAV